MDKIQNLHDFEYWNNSIMCIDILQKWIKITPENEDIKAMIKAYQEMSFYVARLKDDFNKQQQVLIDVTNQRNKWCVDAQTHKRDLENLSNI
jgi:hypothetical protein